MVERLIVLLSGAVMGEVTRLRRPGGRRAWRFSYVDGWRIRDAAIPLSVSLPLTRAEHEGQAVEAFMQGLLPDRRQTLEAWGREFQVHPDDPFALLTHVGEDCAGAVQFVTDERLDAVCGDEAWSLDELSERDVELRLREVRERPGRALQAEDRGRFSLAGAQSKIALMFDGGRWFVPSGQAPTTEILKPPLPDFDGHVENEAFCLKLAAALRIDAASASVHQFGDEQALVVHRYDRIDVRDEVHDLEDAARRCERNASAPSLSGEIRDHMMREHARLTQQAERWAKIAEARPVLRRHQEDLCQAMGLMPSSKCQAEGGPTPASIAALIRDHSSSPSIDLDRFVDALAYSWLIDGTDAHAKNYSLLLDSAAGVELAPLYDVASLAPYADRSERRNRHRCAMKIGGEYRMHWIRRRHWRALAESMDLRPDKVVARVESLAERLPAAVDQLRDELGNWDAESLDSVADSILEHAADCRNQLTDD